MSLIFRVLLCAMTLGWLGHVPPSAAQAGLVGRTLPVCIARAEPGMTARRLFAEPGRFDCHSTQASYGSGDYWILSAPVADPLSRTEAVPVRYASLWQRHATMYVRYADGAIHRRIIDDVAQAGSIQLGAIVEQRTVPRGVPVDRILWHVEGSANVRGVLVGARVATEEESSRSNVLMAALYSGFLGLCLALLVHNLTLWFALRHRFQLAYVAMVASLMFYGLSSSGALAWLIGGIPNTARLRFNYLTLGLSAAAALVFARSFFERRVFAGWVGRLATFAAGGVVAAATLYALAAPFNVRLLDRLFALSFVPVMICVPAILWRAWDRRSDFLWLFALGWASPVLFGCLRLANSLLPIHWSFWLDNSTLIAMTVEALMSSAAIAYRVRLLARERDEARVEEIAARVLADTDPLTGLLNRRAFLAEAIGREGPQALYVIDIDRFKLVNETLGHDGGDEVLRLFARTLRRFTPANALIARMGGEEFAIVTDAMEPIDPDRLLARLRATRMPFDLTVTASIGSCTGPLNTDVDWKRLYHNADRALFDAKAAGRDRAREGLPVPLAA